MARGRRSFPALRRGGPGPNFSWARFVDEAATVAPTTKVFLAVLSTTIDLDLTIRRNRGRFFVQSDQQAASESYAGAFGIMVVSTVAATVGATAIPGPITDPDANWMVWEPFAGSVLFSSAVGVFLGGFQFEFDSKAMRTMSEDESLVLMVENGQAAGFSFSVASSTLISLRGRS